MSPLIAEQLSFILRHDAFQAGMVKSLIFGIYTTLVLYTLHKIVTERGSKAACRPLTVLMVMMYIIAIGHMVQSWNHTANAFIDHGDSKRSTMMALATRTVAENVISLMTRGVLMFVGDFIMVWRCWELYGRSWSVMVLPAILLISQPAILFTRLVYQLRERLSPIYTSTVSHFALAHMSLTLATTAIVTTLIVLRIVRMGGFRKYQDIITIVIESSALYACALIIYMPFPVHPTMSDIIPKAVLTFVPGISSTLVIARVSLGRGIERTFQEKVTPTDVPAVHQVSALRFGNTTAGTRDEGEESGRDSNTMQTRSSDRASNHRSLDPMREDGLREKQHRVEV